MKCVTATRALTGGKFKLLSLYEIFVSLFHMQTVSISCGCQRQILHIWSSSGGCRKLITIVENLPRCNVEFGKIATENCGPYLCQCLLVLLYLGIREVKNNLSA